MKAAVEAKDYIKHKTQELIADKDEEITLHNDVIRSTTLYDDDGTLKIKQNELPPAAIKNLSDKAQKPKGPPGKEEAEDFWETPGARKSSGEQPGTLQGGQQAPEDDVNII